MNTDDEPRDDGTAYAVYDRLVGRTDADGRIVVPRDALEEFHAKHGETPGFVIQLHNTGGVTATKPVEVRVGETTLGTTVPIQGYGVGSLYLCENLAATPDYARPERIEADSERTYFDGAAHVDFSGDQLLSGNATDLTVSTPDHERTIRFEGDASGGSPGRTESPTSTASPTASAEAPASEQRDTTERSAPGFGLVSGLTGVAAGAYARYAWSTDDE